MTDNAPKNDCVISHIWTKLALANKPRVSADFPTFLAVREDDLVCLSLKIGAPET